MDIQKRLLLMADRKYADFQSALTPTVDRSLFIGVRVPNARDLAKEIYKSGDYMDFLSELPHKYYDENMLHGLIISQIADYDLCIDLTEAFLPYIDNWAVCDIMSPKCFAKNKERLISKIVGWSGSADVYTSRFGTDMLMSHYLDSDFKEEYLEIPAGIRIDDYYAKTAVAWFFATALAKQWDPTVKYIEESRLDIWTHNQTIRKARESRRIPDERKKYLKTFSR